MHELRCKDLDYVLDMSFYEFRLRCFAYEREQQHDWAKFRRVAYASLLAFNIKPSNIPKSESQYFELPLVDEKKQVSDLAVKRFRQAMEKYRALKKVE